MARRRGCAKPGGNESSKSVNGDFEFKIVLDTTRRRRCTEWVWRPASRWRSFRSFPISSSKSCSRFASKFPLLLRNFPDLTFNLRPRSSECDVVRGDCVQTYVPYLFLVIPLGPVTLTGQDYVLVESGCVCKPKYASGMSTNHVNDVLPWWRQRHVNYASSDFHHLCHKIWTRPALILGWNLTR